MNNKTNKKKILIVAGTHGNEPIGPSLLENLKNQVSPKLYDSVIGNPRALKRNVRFTETDLNRAAPGNIGSKIYEEKRAAQLTNLFKKFDHIIDIHETKANNKIVIIMPKLCLGSLSLALSFNIKTILIWPPSSINQKTGPLVQSVESGIEMECGTKTSFSKTLASLTKIMTDFLKNNTYRNLGKNKLPTAKELSGKKFYLVYGRINKKDCQKIVIKDFQPTKVNGEIFTPLLFGSHLGLAGYKMKHLDKKEVIYNLKNNPYFNNKSANSLIDLTL